MSKNSKIIELEQKIVDARNEYYNTGNSLISDEVYDLWVDALKAIDPENILIAKIGAEPVSEWEKQDLPISMGSLDKAQNPEEFLAWRDSYNGDKPLIVMDKIDGLSICVEYKGGKMVRALTRGGGTQGENIYKNVLKMSGAPYVLPIIFTGYLRGEILLKKSKHQKHFPDYSNPRNAASGISRRYDGVGCEHLDVMFYYVESDVKLKTHEEMLFFLKNTLGLQIPNYKVIQSDQEAINEWDEYQKSKRAELNYEIDGLVYAFDDLAYHKSLGVRRERPCGSIAFKFIPAVAQTTIKEISWELGNSGRLTPVALFEPVSLAGTTVVRASLHNYSYVKNFGISKDATVIVAKRNEIIPQIEEVIVKSDNPIDYPKKCPACGFETEFSGEYLVCGNILNCPAHKAGRIRNWTNTQNLLEWGSVLAESVVESGLVNTVADLYKLTATDLEKLPRMGKKSAKRALDILNSNKELKLENFLGGLSIPMIGTTLIKTLIDNDFDNVDKFMSASVSDFEKVSGMGMIKAKSLYNGLKANELVIKELFDLGITIKEKEQAMKGGKLDGMSFVMTGEATHSRAELTDMIEENGGTVKGSVNKTLSYLICEDTSTTKYAKAVKLGIKIISEKEFLDMIE